MVDANLSTEKVMIALWMLYFDHIFWRKKHGNNFKQPAETAVKIILKSKVWAICKTFFYNVRGHYCTLFIFQLDEEEAFIISFFDLFGDVTRHSQMDPAASNVIKVLALARRLAIVQRRLCSLSKIDSLSLTSVSSVASCRCSTAITA